MTAPTATAPDPTALSVDVRTPDGDSGRSVELPAEVFAAKVNVPLIHQVVVAQLAAARQGTHSTKTRGEVRGGGAKPYRQKGTGRARQGSTRAPQFVGGGTVHGPTPRDYSQRTPKKMKAAALRGALSDRAAHGRIHVVSALSTTDAPSTKSAVGLLGAISSRPHVLVVAERSDAVSWKSLRNAETVHLLDPGQLNTYDVLVSDDIVFTESALAAFLAPRPKGRAATARASSAELYAARTTSVATGAATAASGGGTEVPGHNTPGEDLAPHNLDSVAPSIVQPGAEPGHADEPSAAAAEADIAAHPSGLTSEPEEQG